MPFLKEEKSEHERALRAGESYPTPLRATLRTPSFKNGQSRAFSRSRRAACFLWYFLSLRKKVLPPSGRQPHRPRRSRRVIPHRGNFLRQSCRLSMQAGGLSARPLHPFGSPPEAIERPIGLQALPSRRSRRVNPHQREISSAKLLPMMQAGWLSSGQTICAARTAAKTAYASPK